MKYSTLTVPNLRLSLAGCLAVEAEFLGGMVSTVESEGEEPAIAVA
jgi:hypothetical protein